MKEALLRVFLGLYIGTSTQLALVQNTYDNQDRLLTYNNLTFTYNDNGERTSRTDTLLSQTTTYDYNALGQLERVTLPSLDQIDYLYDGQGRRAGRSYNGSLTDLYVYEDDLKIVADLNPLTGEVKSRYIYVSQNHSPDSMIRGSETYKFIKDHLGSIKFVVRVSDGSIIQAIEYDEFGKVLSDSNPGFQPFGFAGGIYDHQANLTKFGVRDYDGEVGRWLTKDPIRFDGGDPNLYGYVLQDPVNLVDPKGEHPLAALAAIAAVGVAGGFFGAINAIEQGGNPAVGAGVGFCTAAASAVMVGPTGTSLLLGGAAAIFGGLGSSLLGGAVGASDMFNPGRAPAQSSPKPVSGPVGPK
jgi:RHS repeat-associated protein